MHSSHRVLVAGAAAPHRMLALVLVPLIATPPLPNPQFVQVVRERNRSAISTVSNILYTCWS